MNRFCKITGCSGRAAERPAVEPVLLLPERAKLVERLLDSLDNFPEQESEALWLDVAERRAREIDQEQVQLVSPEELELRVRAHLK